MTASHEWVRSLLKQMDGRIAFDKKAHKYAVDGEPLDSVTTIIGGALAKPILIPWAAKVQHEADKAVMEEWFEKDGEDRLKLWNELHKVRQAHKRESRDAADIGTEAHELIEHHSRALMGVEGERPKVTKMAEFVFDAWKEWSVTVKYQPIAIECKVYHPIHKYSGMIDVVAHFDGLGLAVADWKGAKYDAKRGWGGIWPDYTLQNLAYRAVLDYLGIETTGVVVRLPRNCAVPPNVTWVGWDDKGFEAFLGLKKAYEWLKTVEK